MILVPEVQIAVQQVGICGSDVKYWKDGGIGHFVVTNPLLLGHEVSGVISKVGEGVDHLKIGKTRLVHVYEHVILVIFYSTFMGYRQSSK